MTAVAYWLYFQMSTSTFFLMILHISAYFFRCLSSPFHTIARPFIIRAHVGDDILDFSGLLIVLAILVALYRIMHVMLLPPVSMLSRSCSRASNRHLNSI